MIVDNFSALKTEPGKAFLEAPPNGHPHSTPNHSSSLILIERWLSKGERDVIACGMFTQEPGLRWKPMGYIREHNKAPKLVKWKYFDPSRRIAPTSAVMVH